MPDKIKLLYEAVSKDYEVGTLDEFSNKLQDEKKRKAFYDGVGAEYDLGDYATFSGKVKKKQNSQPASVNGSPLSGIGSNPFQSSKPNQKISFAGEEGTFNQTPVLTDAQKERMDATRQRESDEKLSSGLGLTVKSKGLGSSLTNSGGLQQDFTNQITNKRSQEEQRLDGAVNTYREAQGDDVSNEVLNASQNKQQEILTTDAGNTGNGFGVTYNSLVDGVGTVMQGFTRLAGGFVDAKAQELNNTIQAGIGVGNSIAGEKNKAPKLDTDPLVLGANVYSKVAKEKLREYIGADVDKGAEAKFFNDTFYGRGISGLAGSTPAMLMGRAGMIAQAMQGSYESIDNADVDRVLSEETKNTYAGSTALVVSALEKWGLSRIFRGESAVLANAITKKAIQEASEATGGKITGDILTTFLATNVRDLANKYVKGGIKIFDSILTEYATGSAQELATVGSEFLLNKTTGQSIFDTQDMSSWKGWLNTLDRVNQAGTDESIGGGVMGTLAAGIQIYGTPRKAKIKANNEALVNINQQIENENISDVAIEFLVQKKITLENEIEEETKAEVTEQEKLTPEQKKKAEKVTVEIEKLEEVVSDPALSKETKALAQEQVKVLEQELTESIKPVAENKPVSTAEVAEKTSLKSEEKSVNLDVDKKIGDIPKGKVTPKSFSEKLDKSSAIIVNPWGDKASNYVTKDGVEVTFTDDDTAGEINGIQVQGDVMLDYIGNDNNRGKGFTSRELDRIIAEADKNDISISLIADVDGAVRGSTSEKGLSNDELIAWYKTKGFIFEKGDRYGYRPKKSEDASVYAKETVTAKENEITKDNLEYHSSYGDLQEWFYQGKIKDGTFNEDGGGSIFKAEDGKLKEVTNAKYVYSDPETYEMVDKVFYTTEQPVPSKPDGQGETPQGFREDSGTKEATKTEPLVSKIEILNTGHFGASNGSDGNHEVRDSNKGLVANYGKGTTDLNTTKMFKDKDGNDVDEFHSLPEYKGYRIKTQKSDKGKLVSIHFEAFNVGSNRGGGHGAIVFEVPVSTANDSDLIDKFIPVVEKYKNDNYAIQDGKLRPTKAFDKFEKPDFSLVSNQGQNQGQSVADAEKVLAKAEDDLTALKQVADKPKKYEASIKRLVEAKKAKLITPSEFDEAKARFDDVLAESGTKAPKADEVKNSTSLIDDNERAMAELEDAMDSEPDYDKKKELRKEFNRLEKISEKAERDSVFSVPLSEATKALNALAKKEKDKPNGFGAFIEKRDIVESKTVVERYSEPKSISDKALMSDFKNALMGNPDTWYADGLKLRESINLATKRGITVDDLLKTVEKEFTNDGFTEVEAKKVIARILMPIFKGSEQQADTTQKQLAPKADEKPVDEEIQEEPIEEKKVAEAPKEEAKSELTFTTHNKEVVSGKKLTDAINKVADDWADLHKRIREEDGYASHVTEEQKDEYLKKELERAEEIRNGVGLDNFTIWQRIDTELTGETVPFLPKETKGGKASTVNTKPDRSATDSGATKAKGDEPLVSELESTESFDEYIKKQKTGDAEIDQLLNVLKSKYITGDLFTKKGYRGKFATKANFEKFKQEVSIIKKDKPTTVDFFTDEKYAGFKPDRGTALTDNTKKVKQDALDNVIKGGDNYDLEKQRFPDKKSYAARKDETKQEHYEASIYAGANGLIDADNKNAKRFPDVYAIVNKDKEGLAEMVAEGTLAKYTEAGLITEAQKRELESIVSKEEEQDWFSKALKGDSGTAETKKEEPAVSKTKIELAQEKVQSAEDDLMDFVRNSRKNASMGANLAEFSVKVGKLIAAYGELGIVKLTDVLAKMRDKYGDEFVDDNLSAITEVHQQTYPKEVVKEEAKKPDPIVSGIKKALVSDEIIASVNLDKISDKDMLELGEKLVQTGEINPKAIVDDIAGGNKRALQPKEVVALIWYKANLDNQRRDLLVEANQLQQAGEETGVTDVKLIRLQEDINAYEVMSVITAQQQSLAFRLRKGLLDRDYNIVTQIEQYKKTNGGFIPADIEAKFKAMGAELADLKLKLAEAEKNAIEAQEKESVANIKEDVERSTTRRKSVLTATEQAEKKRLANKYRVFNDATRMLTILAEKDFRTYAKLVLKEAKGDFIVFANDLLKNVGVDIKEHLPKLYEEIGGKGQANLSDLTEKPFVKDGELVIPSAFIREQVENGLTDINELSEAVKAIVQADLPNITVREVRDAITKYGKTVNQTKDDIQKQINEAKRLGKLYSKLEDLNNKKAVAKNIKQVNEISAEEKDLKRQIRVLENGMPRTPDEIRADNRKKYLAKFIAEKEERLRTGNFNPKPKPKPLIADSETAALEARANQIRNDYDAAHYDNEQANRTWSKKAYDTTVEWATGLTRALVAGLDFGAFLVQGALFTTSMNPKKTGLAVKQSFLSGIGTDTNPFKSIDNARKFAKELGSEKYEREFLAQIRSQPYYAVIKASQLAIQEPNAKLGERDDALQASVINKIWAAAMYPVKIYRPSAYEIAMRMNPYRAGERAYTGAINSMRLQLFLEFANDLEKQGYSFESNPEMYRTAANTANNMTFRGRLRFAEGISKELAVVYFAPRKVTAALSLVNPAYWVHLGYSNPIVAKKALLKMATAITMMSTVTIALQAMRDDEDEDENPDMFNPISPDFMKLRIGNTRIDLFSGMLQNVILFARMITNQTKSANSSKPKTLGQDAFTPTRLDVISKTLLANKQSPFSRMVYNKLNESKGRMVEWDDEVVNSVTAMWVQNITELKKEHPQEMTTFLTMMSFLGMSNSTYGTADFLDQDKDAKLLELVKDKNASFRVKTKSNIDIIDTQTGEVRHPDKEEYEVYKKAYGDYIKENLKQNFKEYSALPVVKFEDKLSSVKTKANEIATLKTTGVYGKIGEIEIGEGDDKSKYELSPAQIKERLAFNKEFLSEYGGTIREAMKENQDVLKLSDAEIELKLQKQASSYSQGQLIIKYGEVKGALKLKE